ncbi:putative gamma-glutamyltransferase [Agrobacterium rubi TR3 = NBRC 13261]|uniref:Putative gamma-glutamyltransferase n=1 Tax=Agrobacterium rubi TR3 = NBRC 13261 TaxID=1368415 RepID=A0A081D199_9HYPH|nr:gamma-glutamyltransferase [Agrobacterium rubi]MBP1880523.1 gamma-glutamyltranspeptidase/glutathione hydrolase [Agrobacterium rubi]GAK72695.1 putative gamma-glutamyltransferase [Agrobacterium rubi TR3 = NBRC 13261]
MQTWTIQKPSVESRTGIVSAQNRFAAEAGANVLAKGGNAMDAAVVTGLVLSIVEPWLSGIGGGGFLLHADVKTGDVHGLDFGVKSSRRLNPESYPITGDQGGDWFNWPGVKDDRNLIGYSSICVPGTIAGFSEALRRFGTLSWAEALAPAIEHAERGLLMDWYSCFCIATEWATLSTFPTTSDLFMENGKPPRTSDRAADVYRPMNTKAKVLRRLAEVGARDFYEGDIAKSLVRDLNAGGSPIDLEDLASYQPRWVEPRTMDYRGVEINVMPGLSGGPSFIDAMELLANSLSAQATPDATSAVAYATAARTSYRKRLTTMGQAATPDSDCTSHISVVDAHGNMVSLTNTLLSRFGSKVALPETGFLMNNGMMWFDPRPGYPNSIAAGVKPLANMCPLLLRKEGKPFMAIGAAGGRQIFPALTQLVSFVVDFGLTLEDAFHRPRIDSSTPTIKIDQRDADDIAAAVSEHYPVEIVDNALYPVNFAIPSAVMIRSDGMRVGQAHPYSPWAHVAAEGNTGKEAT